MYCKVVGKQIEKYSIWNPTSLKYSKYQNAYKEYEKESIELRFHSCVLSLKNNTRIYVFMKDLS